MRINHFDVRVFPILAAMLTSLLLLWPTLPVQAQSDATITVNTAEDESNSDGDCSLREAVEAANTNAAVDECRAGSGTVEDLIVFELGKKATITLDPQLGQLNVTDGAGLSIDGGKKKDITVSGDNAVRVFQVNPGAELALSDLTVADADAGFDFGGGVRNAGSLTVVRSTFTGNSAGFGGGIYTEPVGTTKVTNSTFHGNSAEDDVVASGFGGGIDNRGTLEVSGSTFSMNSADQNGGGLRNGNVAEVTNSTFFRNSADDFGGGTANNGTMLEVTNTTFSENSAEIGGGVESLESPNTATLRNTIVTNSPSGGNCAGPITDEGYNISSDDTCAFAAQGSRNSTNPRLAGELANNNGSTQTLFLRKGSPAVNAIPRGENGCGTDIREDQRGVKRPQGKGCDIGSFEKKLGRR